METQLQRKSKSHPSFSYRLLPKESGIYLFLDDKNRILYVGKAKDLRNRVSSYLIKSADLGEKTRILVQKTVKIKTVPTHSEVEALLLEAHFVKKYKPRYNIRLTDGKAYPLIRITIKDKYPKALIARKDVDKNSIYFGPFPNAGALRLVLRTVRRIFPFQSVVNHAKRICLYNHLGLCPCPPLFTSKEQLSEYRKDIQRLISFLNGKTRKVVSELKQERNMLAKKEEFEKAHKIQKKIDAIDLITNSSKKFDFNVDPNLNLDLRQKEIQSLRSCLDNFGIPVRRLNRIECYDISNILGKLATGSLVVFINGEKENSLYRRFKIRKNNTPNDFAMMQEVLQRRMRHKEWPYPDLIIIDGGKGQVSSAKQILQKMGLQIPLIGLAKRLETIISSDLRELNLPKDSDALHLVMRIRDEAHRFAISYHRKLRSKTFLSH